MSQPKRQLHTFRAWAGRGSDISYYLNSHHVDFHEARGPVRSAALPSPLTPAPPLCSQWCVGDSARPEVVTAAGAKGVAQREIGVDTEDTIALTATWRTLATGSSGVRWRHATHTPRWAAPAHTATPSLSTQVATYTASWVAAPCDVHSQQRFFYMGQAGEVNVDQARRGYYAATDAHGYKSCNPLFMKYTAKDGRFVGQTGYGYKACVSCLADACASSIPHSLLFSSSLAPSIAEFVSAVSDIQAGRRTPEDFDHELATVGACARAGLHRDGGRRRPHRAGRCSEHVHDDGDPGGRAHEPGQRRAGRARAVRRRAGAAADGDRAVVGSLPPPSFPE